MDGLKQRPDSSIVSPGLSPDFQEKTEKAAKCLLSGGLVAYPAESFYGLAVDATNETAISRLFRVKRRQASRPVLILIPSVDHLSQYVKRIPPVAHLVMETFWPGGLTLVFEANPTVSPLLTAGTRKIGVRLSSHPKATALARAAGVAISGTSANRSGEPPCCNAKEVEGVFGKEVDLILDGGESPGGMGSTILDVTVNPPRILRQGLIAQDKLTHFITSP